MCERSPSGSRGIHGIKEEDIGDWEESLKESCRTEGSVQKGSKGNQKGVTEEEWARGDQRIK